MKGDGKKFLGSFMANAMELENMKRLLEFKLNGQTEKLK